MTIPLVEVSGGSHHNSAVMRQHHGFSRPHCRERIARARFEKGSARMPPVPLVDPASIDTSRVLVDQDGIRRANPQRFEMEQLTAIVHLDLENKLIIGYKDVDP